MRTQGAEAREEAGDEAPQDSRRRSIPLRDGGDSDLPSQTLPACRVQSQKLRQPTLRTWPTKRDEFRALVWGREFTFCSY